MKKLSISMSEQGEYLSEALQKQDVDIDLPCAGNHSCGKCKVKVSGTLSPISPAEACFLNEKEINAGIRLACFARLQGDVEVEIAEEGTPLILIEGANDYAATLQPRMPKDQYGVAIDIGTTTVVCALYRGDSPQQLGTVSEMNRQRRFGADVISRINYGINNSVEEVHNLIVTQLEEMLTELCAKCDVPRDQVTYAVVTGNCTMLHFFTGLDPRGIGFVPFTPLSLFDTESDGPLAGMKCYCPPCISSYAGADLVCCILISEMMNKDQTAAIVDIGTNGEMALLHNGKLYSCSTAAGPAFEGAGIKHGLSAQSGAICKVHFDAEQQQIAFSTINDAPACGICGSGMVDVLAALYSQGAISAQGLLLESGHVLEQSVHSDEEGAYYLFPGTEIVVTQQDIRQVQLAKGAVLAGLLTLMAYAGISAEDLDVFYLCGGFGSYLDLVSAECIGLIPAEVRHKTVVLGNGALSGAARTLLYLPEAESMRKTVSECQYIELSADMQFMDNYLNAMNFGVTEG